MAENEIYPLPVEDCMVCRKHRGEIEIPGGAVHSDRLIFVGHAAMPADGSETYPGIFIIEPLRHIPGPEDLTDQEARALGIQMTRLSKALRACTDAEHVYIFRFGHHVAHLHIFIVPRYPGTPREYWGPRVDEWPDGPRATSKEIDELCERVRSFLHNQA
jgi:diadenosine tetraphosphate (Ap4A) HIT family hydrolase